MLYVFTFKKLEPFLFWAFKLIQGVVTLTPSEATKCRSWWGPQAPPAAVSQVTSRSSKQISEHLAPMGSLRIARATSPHHQD